MDINSFLELLMYVCHVTSFWYFMSLEDSKSLQFGKVLPKQIFVGFRMVYVRIENNCFSFPVTAKNKPCLEILFEIWCGYQKESRLLMNLRNAYLPASKTMIPKLEMKLENVKWFIKSQVFF